MANHILVVRNEREAVACKKKYPTLLEGVPLYFSDESQPSTRRRAINTVYHPSTIPSDSHILKKFPKCDGFVALSI